MEIINADVLMFSGWSRPVLQVVTTDGTVAHTEYFTTNDVVGKTIKLMKKNSKGYHTFSIVNQ